MLKLYAPDAIHLVTEGPLGWAARAFCLKRDIPFTTAYHTRFPEYVRARIRVPIAWSYAFVRRFHAPSAAVLVVAQSIRDELSQRGFREPRAVVARRRHRRLPPASAQADPRSPADLALCRTGRHREEHQGLPRSRPARHQVGGGRRPAAQGTEAPLQGRAASSARSIPRNCRARYAEADCFVFPSRTDTFGLVMVEALASGVPVAGYPVPGPLDVVTVPERRRHRRGPAHRLPRRHQRRSRGLPTPRRDLHLGTAAPSSSWPRLAPDPAQRLAAAASAASLPDAAAS